MKSITLVGKQHYDEKSWRRSYALGELQPTLLTQELSSHNDYEYILRNLHKRAREGFVPDYIQQNVHFEGQRTYRKLQAIKLEDLLGASRFARYRNIPIEYIDHPNMAQEKFEVQHPEFMYSMQQELIEMLNRETYEEIVDQHEKAYTWIRWLLRQTLEVQTQIVDENDDLLFNKHRDRYSARRLINLAEESDGSIVHECGLMHLVPDAKKRTLASILKEEGIPYTATTLAHYG